MCCDVFAVENIVVEVLCLFWVSMIRVASRVEGVDICRIFCVYVEIFWGAEVHRRRGESELFLSLSHSS